MVSIQPPPCPPAAPTPPASYFNGKGLHAARLITVASRVAALMTFSFLRGSDSSPCDHRLRLSGPALKRRRRLPWFHYRSLASQRACYSSFFFISYFFSMSRRLSRRGERSRATPHRRETDRVRKAAAGCSPLASPSTASSPSRPPGPIGASGGGFVADGLSTLSTVSRPAWLTGPSQKNCAIGPKDPKMLDYISPPAAKAHQDPARIPPVRAPSHIPDWLPALSQIV